MFAEAVLRMVFVVSLQSLSGVQRVVVKTVQLHLLHSWEAQVAVQRNIACLCVWCICDSEMARGVLSLIPLCPHCSVVSISYLAVILLSHFTACVIRIGCILPRTAWTAVPYPNAGRTSSSWIGFIVLQAIIGFVVQSTGRQSACFNINPWFVSYWLVIRCVAEGLRMLLVYKTLPCSARNTNVAK